MAIADIIHQCERKEGSNLDANLVIVEYNLEAITEIIIRHPIETVYFNSRFVERKFKSAWKDVLSMQPALRLVSLPSPSPRYARMRLDQKITRYAELLPNL